MKMEAKEPWILIAAMTGRRYTWNPNIHDWYGGNLGPRTMNQMFMDSINILCWNCRAMGNQNFIRNLKEKRAVYRPEITALLEPQVRRDLADKVCECIGWGSWYRVTADGFSRGMWILLEEGWM